MSRYRFVPALQPAAAGAAMDAPAAGSGSPGGAVLNNLLVHIPTEAVAVATLLSPMVLEAGEPQPLRAWILLVLAAVVTITVRWVNNATRDVWITTAIAFVLWMSLVPHSALAPLVQAYRFEVPLLMITAGFSAVVGALGSAGKLK